MSSISRVGTFQSQNFILEQVTKSTVDYVKLQEQVTTGYKSQRFSGIHDYAAMSVNLENNFENLNQYVEASNTTNSRLSATHTALANILDVVSNFRAQMLQGMTADQANTGRLDEVAEGYLTEVEASLNTDLGGVYLFGGVISNEPPVDLSDPVSNLNGTYYTGASQLLVARIDSSTVLEYGATADRQGFKDLIAGLERVSSASGDLEQLETALDDINSALQDLTELEAILGHQMDVVERSVTRNTAVQATVENQLSAIQDVDVSKAMVELTQRETILQASYMVISRSSDMTLVNYL